MSAWVCAGLLMLTRQHVGCLTAAHVQVQQQAVVFRAARACQLKVASTAVVSLPWVYGLPALFAGEPTALASSGEPEAGLRALPAAELADGFLIVRSAAYPV